MCRPSLFTVALSGEEIIVATSRNTPRRTRSPGVGPQTSKDQQTGNEVGVDPHKHTLTASVLDPTGAVLDTKSFNISGTGHRDMEAFALEFGPVRTWAIEGASGYGRHTAILDPCRP